MQTAEACADYYITHTPLRRRSAVGLRGAGGEPQAARHVRGAIAAAGLLRLCRMLPDPVKGLYYWATALRILRSLCEKHTAKDDPNWEGILKGGVYHIHKKLGVDESVMWGEYFFCEALENALRHSPVNKNA